MATEDTAGPALPPTFTVNCDAAGTEPVASALLKVSTSSLGFAAVTSAELTVGAVLSSTLPLTRMRKLVAVSAVHSPVESASLLYNPSATSHPDMPPESSESEVVDRTIPAVPSTITQYSVSALSVVSVGAVNVRVPPALGSDGLERVTTSVVLDGRPVASFTEMPDFDPVPNTIWMSVSVYPPEFDPVVNPCAWSYEAMPCAAPSPDCPILPTSSAAEAGAATVPAPASRSAASAPRAAARRRRDRKPGKEREDAGPAGRRRPGLRACAELVEVRDGRSRQARAVCPEPVE